LFGHVALENEPRLAGFAAGELPDNLALLCWLFPDEIAGRIEALLTAGADERAALSEAEAAEQRSTLQATILMVERAECAAVRLTEAQNFRADTDVRALLCLA
jgi:hypothetical protein